MNLPAIKGCVSAIALIEGHNKPSDARVFWHILEFNLYLRGCHQQDPRFRHFWDHPRRLVWRILASGFGVRSVRQQLDITIAQKCAPAAPRYCKLHLIYTPTCWIRCYPSPSWVVSKVFGRKMSYLESAWWLETYTWLYFQLPGRYLITWLFLGPLQYVGLWEWKVISPCYLMKHVVKMGNLQW